MLRRWFTSRAKREAIADAVLAAICPPPPVESLEATLYSLHRAALQAYYEALFDPVVPREGWIDWAGEVPPNGG